jgi:hypothetical protein
MNLLGWICHDLASQSVPNKIEIKYCITVSGFLLIAVII